MLSVLLAMAMAGPTVQALSANLVVGQVWEARVAGVSGASNPYDSSAVQVDVAVQQPNGVTLRTPAFYYRGYTRSLVDGSERLAADGVQEWRVRFTPQHAGVHQFRADQNGLSGASLQVEAKRARNESGFLRRTAANPRNLELSTGKPFVAIGLNLCWPQAGGTFDYDQWLAKLAASGVNFVRLWFSPWYFGFENFEGELTNYRQDRLWQMDTVLRKCDALGIKVQLCLDYHGMFQTEPDMWGGNDMWNTSPYNAARGGMCASPAEFFSRADAKTAYKKRLRYLVGRYAAFPSNGTWEFFNEIDLVLGVLNEADVLAWHTEMAQFLKASDPYGRPVGTSLAFKNWPEMWQLPAMEFANLHSYKENDPARTLANRTGSYLAAYGKPFSAAEFGVDYAGYNRPSDPYWRGFRQGLFGPLAGGSMGTAMPWWWENLDADNAYPLFAAAAQLVKGSDAGRANWAPRSVSATSLGGTLDSLGDMDPAGTPFSATLLPNQDWESSVSGVVNLIDADRSVAQQKRLNAFFQGNWHESLRRPFQLNGHFGANGKLILHLNSVSDGAVLVVKVDGAEVFRQSYPNSDGLYSVNNEYNLDIAVPIAAGRRKIEVFNAGNDWMYFDWFRVEGVRPAIPIQARLPVDAYASGNKSGVIAYLVDPNYAWPKLATVASPETRQRPVLTVPGLLDGIYRATWIETLTGRIRLVTSGRSSKGTLRIEGPAFREDLLCRITRG